MQAFERTLSDGRKLTVDLTLSDEMVQTTVRIDGVAQAASGLRRLPSTIRKNDETYTYALGQVLITDAELTAIRDAERHLDEAQPVDLREHRRELNETLTSALDEVESVRERAYEAGRSIPAYDADADVLAAREALARFDAEHPEIVAEIERERSESAARLANN